MSTTLETMAKPSGIPVFPPHRNPEGDHLLQRLLLREPWRQEVEWPEGFEGGVAHRLDVQTSGAVVVASSLEQLVAVRDAFREKRFTKRYLLLVAAPSWTQNRCEAPIAHCRRKRKRMVVQRGASTPHRGKWYPAATAFRQLERFGELALFEARMQSGVMHQIRVHAAFLGIPLVGDRIYGGSRLSERFFLHHQGLVGGGFRSKAVPDPEWATTGLPAPP